MSPPRLLPTDTKFISDTNTTNRGFLTPAAGSKRSRTFQFVSGFRIPNCTRCTLAPRFPRFSLAASNTPASIASIRSWKALRVSGRVALVSRAITQTTGSSLVSLLLAGGVGQFAGAVVEEGVALETWLGHAG